MELQTSWFCRIILVYIEWFWDVARPSGFKLLSSIRLQRQEADININCKAPYVNTMFIFEMTAASSKLVFAGYM